MATLAPQGRIDEPTVRAEIVRLKALWGASRPADTADETVLRDILPASRIDELDLFDRVQLAAVMRICRGSASLSEAGRRLFSQSRLTKTSGNDADRLRKYLARFSLSFADCRPRA